MYVAATFANCAISDAIPSLEIQKRHHRSVELKLFGPESVVAANVTPELSPLHNNWTMLAVTLELSTETPLEPSEHVVRPNETS